ncbi:MAG: 3-hydroxyacyl-CoA dehydrogenase [Rhodospirillaceae bacterium]|nr:3-hydroxyacyl-CoA dehydrogenase [Rhodospirillaceae bacterium]MBT6117707.1 3-hydroxyacyl-CoA dehydrogenase [Rhodospirillaceae bacterium]
MQARQPIALIGSGTIGRGWAIVFARAGHRVALFDKEPRALDEAMGLIESSLRDLSAFALLDEAPSAVLARIRLARDPGDAVAGAVHVQESVAETVEVKRAVFAELDRLAAPDALLASSSSAIVASRFTEGLEGRGRCLIAHPAAPPFLVPIVEIVPAPWTDPGAVESARALMERAGQTPIVVKREIEGFVFNRLQGALLREAYCLIRDGYATAEDIDRAVVAGPGRRWAITGPFENADLNYRGGVREHATRMGPAYARMGAERGQDDPWTDELVAGVEAERHALLPRGDWAERVAWRDRRLMALAALWRRDSD